MAGAEPSHAAANDAAVEVAFSPGPREVLLVSVPWHDGLTAAAAVLASGLAARFPAADPSRASLGCWGRLVPATERVRPGDRIEVYRALVVDPKEARRQRYRAQGPKRKPPQPRRPRPQAPAGPLTAPTDTPS
jgi:putative ubiquitin-RnfH superfamily antitoxin RatB of RatAB toxin-antitoxin module